MNRIIQLLILVFGICSVLSACIEEKKDFVVLGGQLRNISVDSVYMRTQRISQSGIAPPVLFVSNGEGKFIDTLKVSKGYYNLEIDEGLPFELYLEPGFNLEMDISRDSISYKGIGKKENNYLQKKRKLTKEIRHLTVYTYYPSLEENIFLKVLDSVSKLQVDLLVDSDIENVSFIELEKKSIFIRKIYDLMGYEIGRRLLTDEKEFKVSQNFPKINDLIDFNDERFLDVTMFPVSLVLNDYFFLKDSLNFNTSSNRLKCDDCDPHFESLAFMGRYLKNEKVRDEVCYVIAKWRMSNTAVLDEFYDEFRAIVKNEEYLRDIKKLYENLKESKGVHFLSYTNLNDREDNNFKLIDLRGKYVYLDFWASSCKPCIEEFSDFNNLVKELDETNIHFVGINISDSKERWLQIMEKHKLKGVQLIADKNLDFLDSLGVSAIPRYMLLDEDGKLVDYNAKRPSDPSIKEGLLEINLNKGE